jgi:hypothetical protein
MPSPAEYREQAAFDQRMAARSVIRALVAQWREEAQWQLDRSAERDGLLEDRLIERGRAEAYTVAANELDIALSERW